MASAPVSSAAEPPAAPGAGAANPFLSEIASPIQQPSQRGRSKLAQAAAASAAAGPVGPSTSAVGRRSGGAVEGKSQDSADGSRRGVVGAPQLQPAPGSGGARGGLDADGSSGGEVPRLERRDSNDSVSELQGDSDVSFARFKPASARAADRHDSVDLQLEQALSTVADSLRPSSKRSPPAPARQEQAKASAAGNEALPVSSIRGLQANGSGGYGARSS